MACENGISGTVVELTSCHWSESLDARPQSSCTGCTLTEESRFRLGVCVAAFVGSSAVEVVELDNGERLPAQTVVVGVGVLPQVGLAEVAGLDVDRFGIVVDESAIRAAPGCQRPATSRVSPTLPTRGRIEHWMSRNDMARSSVRLSQAWRHRSKPSRLVIGIGLATVGRRQPLRLLGVVVLAGVVVAVVQAVQQRQWAVAAVLSAVAVCAVVCPLPMPR